MANAQATVSFDAPVNDGGSPITEYTVSAFEGNATVASTTMSGAASPITVTGLTNGVSYTFTVHATNSAGNSAESAPSNAVTPTADVPGAPTNVVAV